MKKRLIIPIVSVVGILVSITIVTLILRAFSIKDIFIAQETIYLGIGQSYPIGYHIQPSYLKNQKLEWSSDNADVIVVNNGIVTGIKEGSSTVTVKSRNGKEASCKIVVSNIMGEWEWNCAYISYQKTTNPIFKGSFSVEEDNCTFVDYHGEMFTGKWKYEENRKGVEVYSFDADGYLDFIITVDKNSLTVSPELSTDVIFFFDRKDK